MARIRITLTTDAAHPRVVYLGNKIAWYAYVRPTDVLCIQREVNGVRDPEVQVCSPVKSLDVIQDPVDPTKGWIYFIHDGILERIQVTPLAANLTAVAYLRIDGWYQGTPISGGTGLLRQWTTTEYPPLKRLRQEATPISGGTGLLRQWSASEGPDPPSITIERTNSGINVLITSPNRNAFRNRNITQMHVWRKQTSNQLVGGDWALHATVDVPTLPHTWEPPLPALVAAVPGTTTPVSYWAVSCVRTGYLPAESVYSNIATDDGTLPVIYVDSPKAVGGTHVYQTWTTFEWTPMKRVRDDQIGAGVIGPGGTGLMRKWIVNGTSIINP
jgi:hypothetical protein